MNFDFTEKNYIETYKSVYKYRRKMYIKSKCYKIVSTIFFSEIYILKKYTYKNIKYCLLWNGLSFICWITWYIWCRNVIEKYIARASTSKALQQVPREIFSLKKIFYFLSCHTLNRLLSFLQYCMKDKYFKFPIFQPSHFLSNIFFSVITFYICIETFLNYIYFFNFLYLILTDYSINLLTDVFKNIMIFQTHSSFYYSILQIP